MSSYQNGGSGGSWRPRSTRPVLSAGQLRALKGLGYTGPCYLHDDEAAVLIRLYRAGRGARKREGGA